MMFQLHLPDEKGGQVVPICPVADFGLVATSGRKRVTDLGCRWCKHWANAEGYDHDDLLAVVFSFGN